MRMMEDRMTINWEDKYSVKINKIDDQHQMFFNIINSLETATKQEEFMEDLPRILNEIVEFCGLHFKTEEEILKLANYENYAEHKSIHEKFEKEIRLECSKVLEKDTNISDVMWLYDYLTNWLIDHILEEDHKYIESLKEYYDL